MAEGYCGGNSDAGSFTYTDAKGKEITVYKNLSWRLEQNSGTDSYTLLIDGSGAMSDSVQWRTDPTYAAYKDKISAAVVEKGVTSIPNDAFREMGALKTVSIPASVSTIGGWVFLKSPVESVVVDKGNASFMSDDSGVLYSKDQTKLIYFPKQITGSYALPSTVVELASDSFFECLISEVDLSKATGLTALPHEAFKDAKLTRLVLPENIKTIGAYSCAGLNQAIVRVCSPEVTISSLAFDKAKAVDLTKVDKVLEWKIVWNNNSFFGGCDVYVSDKNHADEWNDQLKSDNVTYVLNGGSVGDDGTVSKDGYLFDGWYSDPELTEKVPEVQVHGRYYAKWVCEVSFDPNGGEGSMESQMVDEGGSASLPENAFSKTGYTFTGWNTEVDGSGVSFAPGATIDPEGSTVLYAQWSANGYTVKFDANGGQSDAPADMKAIYDTELKVPAFEGTAPAGKRFCGWAETKEKADKGVVDYSAGSGALNLASDPNAEVVLYAVWADLLVPDPVIEKQSVVYNGSAQAFRLQDDQGLQYEIAYSRNGEPVEPVAAGVYDVEVSRPADGEYAQFHYQIAGGLVIEKAALTVRADDKTMYVGSDLPEFTCATAGYVGGDDEQNAGFETTFACDADGKTVGSYDIVVSGPAQIDNYVIAYEDGTLTVSNRPVAPSDKVEVVQRPDGSTVTTVTKPDGSKTVETENAEGTTVVVAYDAKGIVTSISAEVSKEDAEDGAAALPMDGVDAPSMAADAVSTEVGMPESVTAEKPLEVFVPVASQDVGHGVVVAAVGSDGSLTVLPKCSVREGGIVFEATGDTVFKVFDNAKAMPDVTGVEWFAGDVVDFATSRGIIDGVSLPDGTREFRGDEATTRAMFVEMLHNLELSPAAAGGCPLADVPASAWYAGSAAWAVEQGVLTGIETPDGFVFDGEADVTREQVAQFLMRYAAFLGLDTSARAELAFPDAADVSPWAEEAMSWAVAEGLFAGDGNTGELRPGSGATRAEVAVVLMRFIDGLYA
ncbi:MAG: InlB B-repeat-containing protein [Slackia sp.]|nr:InlB B-repeat-containing protein [Slackia sp.]